MRKVKWFERFQARRCTSQKLSLRGGLEMEILLEVDVKPVEAGSGEK